MATTSVTNDLRSDILDGLLSPGIRLVEADLVKRYESSRSAVRVSLVELEKEGLVVHQAGRGASVALLSLTDVIELTEARAALESLVVRKVATQASSEERDEIQNIVRQMRVLIAAKEAIAYESLNKVFHARLAEISGHRVARELVTGLRNRAQRHQYRLVMIPGRNEISVEHHAAIADAISNQNPDAAATAMTEHLSSVLHVLQHWADAERQIAENRIAMHDAVRLIGT